jgi:hypothetical protein
MKALAQNWLVILLFVVILFIGAVIYGKINKAKKEEQIRRINEILDKGIGVDGIDIKSITLNTKADTSYNALSDVNILYKSNGFLIDDEEAIYNVFTGKTKAQIAQIYQTFLSTYKQDLDEFLKSFLNLKTEYPNVIRLVNQAA